MCENAIQRHDRLRTVRWYHDDCDIVLYGRKLRLTDQRLSVTAAIIALAMMAACSTPDAARTGTLPRAEQLVIDSAHQRSSDGTQDSPLQGVSLSGGRTVVVDANSFLLRTHDSIGGVVAQAGGVGRGPGEFLSVSALFPVGGDSVAVWDPQIRRLTVFDENLQVVTAKVLSAWPSIGMLRLIGRLQSGMFIGVSSMNRDGTDHGDDVAREVLTVLSGPLDRQPDPIVRLDGSKRLRLAVSEQSTQLVAIPGSPFPRAFAVCGDSIVVIDSLLTFTTKSLSSSRPFSSPVDTLTPGARRLLIESAADDIRETAVREALVERLNRLTPDPIIRSRKPFIVTKDDLWFAGLVDGSLVLDRHIGTGSAAERTGADGRFVTLSLDAQRLFAVRVDSAGARLTTLRRNGGRRFSRSTSASKCGPTYWY
jgi:hypothetical protein